MQVVVEVGTKQLDGVKHLQKESTHTAQSHIPKHLTGAAHFNELVMAKWPFSGIPKEKADRVFISGRCWHTCSPSRKTLHCYEWMNVQISQHADHKV